MTAEFDHEQLAAAQISTEQIGIVDGESQTAISQASAGAGALRALPDRGDKCLAVGDPDSISPAGGLADVLSPRELEVLASIATGATNAEIARQLFIAPSTVKTHVERIIVKLGVRTRTQAAVHYARSYERKRSPDHAAPREGRSSDALVARLAEAYTDAMRLGDPAAAMVVIEEGQSAGLSAVVIQSRLIAPAMRGVGVLWERGVVTVAEEHLATAVSHRVLTSLYPGLPRRVRRGGDTVVVAAVHGEHHALGLRMVADVFEAYGFDVRFLGADVPESSLIAWVQEHGPAAVALGVTMPLGASALDRQVIALRDLDPDLPVIIGGQGVPAVLQQRVGVLYLADTEQLAEHLNLNGSLRGHVPGQLPAGLRRGGVAFSRGGGSATDGSEGPAPGG
jgi:methanogenic corrinoid protein MtbC1/DNA-binding CsgD family transcriptional regulator